MNELLEIELLVAARVKLRQHVLDSLLHVVSLVALHVHIQHGEQHLEHFLELFLVDLAVVVQVVEIERPGQALIEASFRFYVKRHQELLEKCFWIPFLFNSLLIL